MSLIDFKKSFLDGIRNDSALNSTDPEDEFIASTLELLVEDGQLVDPQVCYYYKTFGNNRVMQINGYAYDDVDKSISLFISDFEDDYDPQPINRSRVEDYLCKRLENFLKIVLNNELDEYCDISDEIVKIGRQIRNRFTDELFPILKIKFIVITNKQVSDKTKKLKKEEILGKPVEINVWHIERIYEYMSSADTEPIFIDFKNDFNSDGLPCIKADIGTSADYAAYVAIMPGKLLADIYIEHGSRVLEGNVRAFLGISGAKSVNAGIRRTIVEEPENFFTYNNGIAITASKIQTSFSNGSLMITSLEDMQIINGGQTTATLATMVLKKEKQKDLENIFVPVKITIVNDRETEDVNGTRMYDSMIQKIATYANSQNKVTAADLFSNHPFHIRMEQLSKKNLVSPKAGEIYSTGWYYERSRKKYNQEQMKLSPSEKDKFLKKFPKKQVITKEKLAKYIYSIEQKPHIVAKGANHVMKDFAEKVLKARSEKTLAVNEFYFKKAVASAIIFNTVDSMVLEADWYQKGGYKLNIVPYTISFITSLIPSTLSLNWEKIWQNQEISKNFKIEIANVTKLVNEFITNSKGMIVTEYCKKEDTWKAMKSSLQYELSMEFLEELVSIDLVLNEEDSAKKEEKQNKSISNEIEVYNLGDEYWKQVLEVSKSKHIVNSKEMSILSIASEMNKTGKIPSSAQCKILMSVKNRLEELGIFIK